MYEISIFPLNTVLFPGMPLFLHIFEPRYREMIHACLQNRQPFGVTLIHEGLEAYGPLPEPVRVGCSAHISTHKKFEDGRMDLVAIGDERFRIVNLNREKAYLIGEVESFPLERPHSIDIFRGVRQLVPWIRQYLNLIYPAVPDGAIPMLNDEYPDDPLILLHLAAFLLQIPAVEKQTLLESDPASELLERVTRLYRREIAVFQQPADEAGASGQKLNWLN